MAVGAHDNAPQEYEQPHPFCRAPRGKCVHVGECYPMKACQYFPDDSNVEAEEFSRALGGPGFASESREMLESLGKCQPGFHLGPFSFGQVAGWMACAKCGVEIQSQFIENHRRPGVRE